MLFHSNINKIVLTLIIIGMLFMITACSRPQGTKISSPEKQSGFHQESKAEEEEDTQIDLTDDTNSNSSDKSHKSLPAQEEDDNWGEQESDSSQSGDNKNISNKKENPENSEMSDNVKTETDKSITGQQSSNALQETEAENTFSSSENKKTKKSELNIHTEIRSFKELDGKSLMLTVDLPSNWSLTSPEEELPDQYYIEDETGTKLGGTYGILKVLQDNENLNDLKNPSGYLSPIESSEIITIGNREYLLETTNLSSKQRENLIAYSYSFIQDGTVIQFYFFNDGDKKDKIVIYEEILQSIKATIN